MKVYSPSQTKSFFQCPQYWLLSRQWMPRTFSKMDLYAVRGSGVSAGLDAFNRGESDLYSAVYDAVASDWVRKQLEDRQWKDFRSSPLSFDEVMEQAYLMVETYAKCPPTAFKVIEAEYIFRKHGWARADALVELPGSPVAPIDYKVKDYPTTDWLRNKIIWDFEDEWQLMHYCWAVSEEFKTTCLEYGICLIWYHKKPKVEYVPYTIEPERMKLWLESAKRVWSVMEKIQKGLMQPWEVASHDTKFGPCQFKAACLGHNRNKDLMKQDYIYIGKG